MTSPPGWGCERAIEHQLDAYGLRPTVDHVQGDMAVLASEVIARQKAGQPVVYYDGWLKEAEKAAGDP
jgi:glycine betaine/proline transport system substrate-binding protein